MIEEVAMLHVEVAPRSCHEIGRGNLRHHYQTCTLVWRGSRSLGFLVFKVVISQLEEKSFGHRPLGKLVIYSFAP